MSTITKPWHLTLNEKGINSKININFDYIFENQISVNVINLGVTGNGVTDDTSAINYALSVSAGKTLYFPSGTYICETLTIPSGTTLLGDGAGLTTIKAKSTLSGSAALIKNQTTSGSVNVYYDKWIRIEGITFDGNNLGGNQTRVSELLGFSKCQHIEIRNCRITNVQYMGIAFGGCNVIRMSNCELDNIGDHTTGLSVNGPAVWLGQSLDGSYDIDAIFDGLYIHDCYEAGFNASGNKVKIVNCVIRDVKEAGIFVSNAVTDILIQGNTIQGVTRTNISSSGLEIGAGNVRIIGNLITDTESDNISLTDAQGIIIEGNILARPRLDAGYFSQANNISVITTQSAPNQPMWINIENNIANVGSPYSFVAVGNSGSAIQHVTINGNNVAGVTFSSGKAFNFETGKTTIDVIVRNNVGGGFDPSVVEILTKSSTGDQVITGVGFRPSRVDIHVIKDSTTESIWSDAVGLFTATGTFQQRCHYSSIGGGNYLASTAGSNIAIKIVTPTGTDQIVATYSSLDEDGFTLNYSTAAFQASMRYVCYP